MYINKISKILLFVLVIFFILTVYKLPINHNYGVEENQQQKVLNLKEFAKGNGVDNDTEAIKKALAFARNNGYSEVYAPTGIYLVDAGDWLNSIIIYNNLKLFGDGLTTEFKVNPKSISENKSYKLFLIESNVKLSNFSINGQKDIINRSIINYCDFIPIIGKNSYQKDCEFSYIWIHDVIGIGAESFGIMTNKGASNIKFQNIIGWKIEGTPIHVAGDYLNNKLTRNVTVENCTTFDNTWQGISIYGAKNVTIKNHYSYGNARNGLNFEWCRDVEVYNSKSFNNGKSGFGSYGKANFSLNNCYSKYNNTNNEDFFGEITLSSGSWFKGSPPPTGNVGKVEINSCKIEPKNGKKHLVIGLDKKVNVGHILPDGITINDSNVANWTIAFGDYIGPIKDNTSVPNVYFKGFKTTKRYLFEKLTDFTLTYNINLKSYQGKGNINPDAVTLTEINNQYGNIFSQYILRPYKKYHVKVRYKALSTNKWIVISRDANQTATPYSIILTGDSTIVGQWKIAEGIFKTGSQEQRIQIQYDGTKFPDSIDLDYIDINEIDNS